MTQNYEGYKRKQQLWEIGTVVGGLMFGISILMGLTARSNANPNLPLMGLLATAGIFLLIFSSNRFKKLSIQFKSEFLAEEIKRIYPDSTYDATHGFSEQTVYDSLVLTKQDRFYSEDLIEGNYEGVAFRSADVKLQDVRSTGKSTTVVTVFLGRVYEFEFNKSFKSNLLLTQPKSFRPFESWTKVKTESNAFNSELKIYTTDEHEAFYILTPHFMERLLKLDRKYHDQISFSFINNKVYIAVNTKQDTFDLKMFTPIDKDIIEGYKRQLNDIKSFIHELNLDQTLFSEEN